MSNTLSNANKGLANSNANSLLSNIAEPSNPAEPKRLVAESDDYPTNTVIKQYLLIGGPIGGLLLWPLFAVMTIMDEGVSIGLILDIIVSIISLAVGGLILGFVPALITGIIIGSAKLYFDSVLQAMVIFFIGFTSTIACLLLSTSGQDFTGSEVMALAIATVGGLSAVVCGKLFIPKSK